MDERPQGDFDAVVLCAAEATRDVMTYWLTTLGMRALRTSDGYEADRIVQGRACRLLVTDRVLPPWPGVTEFRRLREINPSLRIAFVEDGNVHNTNLARICGVTDLVPRPLSRKSLVAVLEKFEPAPRESQPND